MASERSLESTPDPRLPAVTDPFEGISQPVVYQPYRVAPGTDVIPSYLPVPGLGVLPCNAFLLRGREPVLVDAGPGGAEDALRRAIESLIDPADISWLWLTHSDPDHTGALRWLLDAAPRMRVVTTYLATGKMGLRLPLPMDRLRWCNPGESIEVGDRTLLAVRPPVFDAPETTSCYDASTRTLFSADCFGGLMAAPEADAADLSPVDLEEGMTFWAAVDAPWLACADPARLDRSLAELAGMDPVRILSAHLPPATGMLPALIANLRKAPARAPWDAPGQDALEAALAGSAAA